MKKNIGILLLVLIIAAGAAYYMHWEREGRLGDLKAAEYLPSDAVALVEITDLPRSKTRWQETALHKIAQEPEVAAFLEKPESAVPANPQIDLVNRFRALNPKEVFVAVTGQGPAGVKVIAGFDFAGSKGDAKSWVADVKTKLEESYPDGKSDVEEYGANKIETFTRADVTVGTVFKGRWFFVSNDMEGLRSTLDRVDGKIDPKTSLRENDTYKLCVAKMPPGSDLVAFVQMKGIVNTLALMLDAAGSSDPAALDELKKIEAISAATKLDGENLRDAYYVYKPGGEARSGMAMNSKAITSPDTVLFAAAAPVLKSAPALPNPALDKTGVLAMLDGLVQGLANAGLGFDEFKAAFGPEIGMAVNWGRISMAPDLLLSLDVRDAGKAQKFVDALAAGWPKQAIGGVQYYAFPDSGQSLISVSPVVALTGKALLLGLNLDSVKKAVEDARSGGPGLDKSADFAAAKAMVGNPTDSFAYIDSGALFDHLYGLLSKAAIMAPFMYPGIGKYVDLGKLPPGEAISKHLGPIVYSQATDGNGSLTESVGPVTFTEVVFSTALGAGAVGAYQMMGGVPRKSGFPHAKRPPAVVPPSVPAPGQPGANGTPNTQTLPKKFDVGDQF